MCPLVNHIPFTSKSGNASYTFLKNVSDVDVEAVQDWLKTIEGYVALRGTAGTLLTMLNGSVRSSRKCPWAVDLENMAMPSARRRSARTA